MPTGGKDSRLLFTVAAIGPYGAQCEWTKSGERDEPLPSCTPRAFCPVVHVAWGSITDNIRSAISSERQKDVTKQPRLEWREHESQIGIRNTGMQEHLGGEAHRDLAPIPTAQGCRS